MSTFVALFPEYWSSETGAGQGGQVKEHLEYLRDWGGSYKDGEKQQASSYVAK